MKRSVLSVSLLLLLPSLLFAQYNNSNDVKRYFNAGLDSIVARFHAPIDYDMEEERTDPAFFRMFVPTVLYKSTLERGLADGFEQPDKYTDSELELCDKRDIIIDRLLLDVYRTRPSLVEVTEDDMRSVVAPSDVTKSTLPEIKLEQKKPLAMPSNIEDELKTKVVRPSKWRTSGKFSLNFTQNYISGNWASGGENNKTMLAILNMNFNYDDKKHITFTNILDVKLGFTTVSSDTMHSIKTNNDMLRLESTLGYKIATNLDLTAKMQLQTQSMPSYPTNSDDFVSNFMAPFDANFSLGFNYKRSGNNWNLSLFFAPLSAYNYKFVRYGHLASRYGMREGRQHREDFGTQVKPYMTAKLFKTVNWTSNMEFYTNYSRAYFNWENTFSVNLNRYFTATLFLHNRFDDSSVGLYSDDYGYWQIKEYMTLGLSYTW